MHRPRLPSVSAKQRPRHVVDYAKSQRQSALKFLAILRWKTAVDMDASSSSKASSSTHAAHPPASHHAQGAASFPTPHSNGESSNTSPAADLQVDPKGKGKARAVEEVKPNIENVRGRVTDAKRITHFMEHQNRQHGLAIEHIQHVAKMIETLRCVRAFISH